MDPALKKKLDELHKVSQRKDAAVKEMEQLKSDLVPMVKHANLTNTKFDYGDKKLKYSLLKEYGGITQKGIKLVLQNHYPSIDPQQFMNQVLATRTYKERETIDISRK